MSHASVSESPSLLCVDLLIGFTPAGPVAVVYYTIQHSCFAGLSAEAEAQAEAEAGGKTSDALVLKQQSALTSNERKKHEYNQIKRKSTVLSMKNLIQMESELHPLEAFPVKQKQRGNERDYKENARQDSCQVINACGALLICTYARKSKEVAMRKIERKVPIRRDRL